MKKIVLFALVLCLTVAMVAAMAACGGIVDKLKDLANDSGDSGDQTSDSSQGSASSSSEFEYESSAAEAAIESMRKSNGYLISYNFSATDEDANTVSVGAKGDIYYVSSSGSEYYYDTSGDEGIVYYTKDNADADWKKSIMKYSEDFTKEEAIESMEAVIQLHSGWLTYYQGFISSMDGSTKSSGTVAGRSCDKYSFSAAALTGNGLNTARASYECYVDKSTSICLKWTQTYTEDGKTESWAMECTEFNANPNFTLPTVEEQADEE